MQPPSTHWRADFPDAYVSTGAVLSEGVQIGVGSVVHDGVQLGAGTVVGEHCVLGHHGPGEQAPLVIGPQSLIRSHAVLYAASRFGARLETGHHVIIRERTVAGENLRIGNFSDVEGDCTIGDYCRFHGYAHIGKGSKIGHFVWLYSLTTATNDPMPPSQLLDPVTIDDGAVVCVGATLMPGAILGRGAFVSAGAVASGAIPAGALIAGPEGRIVGHVSGLMHFASGTRHPWMRHFQTAFPPESHERLRALLAEVTASRLTLSIAQP